MSQTVVVTGATGFVGANLARRLLTDGHDVHLIVRPSYASWRIGSIAADVTLHVTDLDDAGRLDRVFQSVKPDCVYHLAAYGAYPTQKDLDQMVRTNIVGTMNLVQASLKSGCETFVNVGSSSEYGLKPYAANERELPEPNSHYAVTKASATLFCGYTARANKVRIPTLRLYSVYGAYEEPTRLIPTVILRGLDGGLPPLVSPDTSRDFVYIDDVVDACIAAASTPSIPFDAVYNIGSGVQTSVRDVVETAQKLLPITAKPDWGSMAGRIWDTNTWIADISRARAELAWTPQHTFETGLAKTIDWLRTHRHERPYSISN
jgi:UDP-glucose 4-epimerase